MNKLLAGTIRTLNGLIAVLLVISGGATAAALGGRGLSILGGLILGFLVAVLICGVLAILIEIRSELIKIRMSISKTSE